MQIHQLKRKTSNAITRQVGRGGKRGKTSGKGHKGQKARAGRKLRPELRDIIKKLPKLRGHGKNRGRTVNSGKVIPEVVNVSTLETKLSGTEVTPQILLEQSLIKRGNRKNPAVKILGNGELSKKVSVSNCQVSTSAREKIEKAGGTIAQLETLNTKRKK